MGIRIQQPNFDFSGYKVDPAQVNEAIEQHKNTPEYKIKTNLKKGFETGETARQGAEEQTITGIRQYQDTRDALMSGAQQARSGFTREASDLSRGWLDDIGSITGRYVDTQEGLRQQAQEQATNAQQTYTGTILPEQKTQLENARNYQNEVEQAKFSLAESQDPNNRIAQAYRDLYEQKGAQGAGMFQQDIQGTQRQGLADVGILQNLGAQAASQQMAGQPLTGGQMAAIMAQQGRQASEAYAGAKQRMQSLEDQARNYQLTMMGQGVEAGRQETGQAYERSTAARQSAADRMSSRIADIMLGQQQQAALQGGLRGEQSVYGGNIATRQQQGQDLSRGIQSDLLSRKEAERFANLQDRYGRATEEMAIARELAAINAASGQRYEQYMKEGALRDLDIEMMNRNIQTQMAAMEAQKQAAKDAANSNIWSGVLGALGTIGGAWVGAPAGPAGSVAGATAGGVAGRTLGGMNAPAPSQQQYPVSQYAIPNFSYSTYSPYGPYAGGYSYPS